MPDKLKCLMLGAGGMAGHYIRGLFPVFADRLEVVGLVDVSEEPLAASGDFLGLPVSARFTDMAEAYAKVEADFCIICIPPAFHKQAVLLATERKLDVLSEKPIADTWEDCTAIYRAARASGVKFQVVQNYRYNATMLTMKQVLSEGSLGRINYLMGRFAADYRVRGAWGAFRHEIAHSLLIEGSVHHFDMLRNLSGSNCQQITGWEWNPAWSSFDGESSGHYLAKMVSGVVANYEGNCNEAGVQNNWHQEFYRAECEHGSVVIDSDHVLRVWERKQGSVHMHEVPLLQPQYQGHHAIIDQFLNWKCGGPAPVTVIEDNIQSAGMLFGAIEASRTDMAVDVQALVAGIG